MSDAIAKVGRTNHLNSLLAKLPLLTFLYGMQCYLIHEFSPEVEIGNYALWLGIGLISLVSLLYAYDRYHHVLIYKDKLVLHFELLGLSKEVHYDQIDQIITPEEECDYASILLKLKDEKTIVLHFVDYPLQVKKVIEENKPHNSYKMAA